MGGNMGCLNMIPISTVNLVNSVGKKNGVQPENQSSYWRLLRELWWADQIFHVWTIFHILYTYIVLLIWGNTIQYTEMTFKNLYV